MKYRQLINMPAGKKIPLPSALLFLVLAFFLNPQPAQAYIGPGAGFAFVSSFLILFITFLLAILSILFWPLRMIYKALRKKKPTNTNHGVKRVVIVGLDGMDPDLTARYMKEGKLPNFSALSDTGTFKKLGTTLPAMSPVAWSSFITGVDPSRHNIFDFLNRDLRTYMPVLSSTKIESPSRTISIGRYSIPLTRPRVKLLRKGIPFWNVLGEYGIFSSILRVPMTFPPEKLNGTLLSAMCVPDLKGTQGTFTLYSSNGDAARKRTGGEQIPIKVEGNRINTYIPGPYNYIDKKNREMRIPLEVTLNSGDEAELKISNNKYTLKRGAYSQWIGLTFRAGLNMKVSGICRFFIKSTHPDFEMYMTPINIDPERPSLPISYPFSYSVYLSKMIGSFATLGLAEDTWALNERIIDEDTFIEQAYEIHKEREEMFFNALDKTKKGLCVCVFDATDRLQHMFMRFLSDDHPAHANGADTAKYRGVIEDLYRRMDELIGRVTEKLDESDALMIISDHGFKTFTRGVNLNTWLYKNGYLLLKDGKDTGGAWFEDVDWPGTRAYTFGLGGIYINEKGREAKGTVSHEEKAGLKRELITKLRGLIDEETGTVAVKQAHDSTEYYDGPYRGNGPDIIVCYNEGYRASWGAAVGRNEAEVFHDNKKSWSGDHCIDPELVPGILFCNRKSLSDDPHISDIGPTVLDLFGVEVPTHMTGRSLVAKESPEGDR